MIAERDAGVDRAREIQGKDRFPLRNEEFRWIYLVFPVNDRKHCDFHSKIYQFFMISVQRVEIDNILAHLPQVGHVAAELPKLFNADVTAKNAGFSYLWHLYA